VVSVASDNDQGFDAKLLQAPLGVLNNGRINAGLVAGADLGNEMSFIGGSQYGAAEVHDARRACAVEDHIISRT
jgi:hypothetical protein